MEKRLMKTRKRLVATSHVIAHLKFVKPILFIWVVFLAIRPRTPSRAEESMHTPPPRSKERSEVMDNLLKSIPAALKKDVSRNRQVVHWQRGSADCFLFLGRKI